MGLEAGQEGAAVDVVEGRGEIPGVFTVVDFEVAVWWDAATRLLVSAVNEEGDAQDGLYGT